MPRVLIVDDEVRYRELYRQVLEDAGLTVETAATAEQALDQFLREPPDMVVSDVRMPGESGLELLRRIRTHSAEMPFLLVTAFADVAGAVQALKLGAVDYLTKPVDLDELVAAVQDALGITDASPAWEVPGEALGDMVVESPAMRVVVRDAYQVARSEATILLTGESGTGKEVLAELIHRSSKRRDGPLVVVNCGAIAKDLVASELFGHEKGAFTGAATRRLGRFREAGGGTLFLDEIGELPLELQPTLLRVVENHRVSPVGADRELEVDFRLIVATNRDLAAEVESGRFRSDLYYRFNVIALDLPPLRARPEDVLPLARLFLGNFDAPPKRLSASAIRLLAGHSWPGNVRELANAMERAALLSRTEIILPEHLPPAIRDRVAPADRGADGSPVIDDEHEVSTAPEGRDAPVATLAETELVQLRRALDATGGNRTRAAEMLGITRRGLIYKIKRLGLS